MSLKKDIGFKGYEDRLAENEKKEKLSEKNSDTKSKIIIAGIVSVILLVLICIIVFLIVPSMADSTDSSESLAGTQTSESKKKDYDLDYLFGTSGTKAEDTTNSYSNEESSQAPRMTINPNYSSSTPESKAESSSNSDNGNHNDNDNNNSGGGSSQSHSVENNNNYNNNNNYSHYYPNNSNNNNNNTSRNNSSSSSSSSYNKPQSTSRQEESSRNTDIPVRKVTLNYTSTTLYEGDSISLVANVSPSNATNKTVYWSTSNSGVATVNDGYVTAHSSGTTYITARAGNYYVNCTVTVKEKDNVKLSPDKKNISVNQIITVNVIGTNEKASWKISNPSLVQICGGSETSIMIKGKNKGTTYVEATINGKTYKAEITVN